MSLKRDSQWNSVSCFFFLKMWTECGFFKWWKRIHQFRSCNFDVEFTDIKMSMWHVYIYIWYVYTICIMIMYINIIWIMGYLSLVNSNDCKIDDYLRLVWQHTPNQLELKLYMMTSSNGNIFRVTGPLCEEFTGLRWFPRTKASHVELWC